MAILTPVFQEFIQLHGLARAEDIHGAERILGTNFYERENLARKNLEQVVKQRRHLLKASHRIKAVDIRGVVIALYEFNRVALAGRRQVDRLQAQRQLEPANAVTFNIGAQRE